MIVFRVLREDGSTHQVALWQLQIEGLTTEGCAAGTTKVLVFNPDGGQRSILVEGGIEFHANTIAEAKRREDGRLR